VVAFPAGYVAGSADAGAAVVVIHDWFGLLPHVRALCDALARESFLAVAPDLYDGRTTTATAEAEALLSALDEPAALEQVRSAVATAARGEPSRAVGVVAFSAGAYFAFAALGDVVRAAVTYYGTGALDEADRIRCPVLGHFADRDEWPESEHARGYVGEYFDRIRAAGVEATYHVYRGTEHSFANADVDAYSPFAAETAWQRTLAFLRESLSDTCAGRSDDSAIDER
jgi:carboxymethylenebutenolidase